MSDMVEKVFYCQECINSWKSSQYDIGDDDIVYSNCNICQKLCHEVPHYYFNLPKMHEAQKGKHTGPITDEGKERVSLNGFKHGLRTKKMAILAPAKKGKYPDCDGCPYYETCTPDKYCPINLSLLTQFAAAYKNGQISDLKEFAGLMQGNAAITLKMLFIDVLKHGTLVERIVSAKQEEADMTGITREEIVKEWQDNPSLKHIIKYMEVMGVTADQQVMTPAKKVDDDNVQGFINATKENAQSIREFQEKQSKDIADIRSSILKATIDKQSDEAYQEYKKEKETEQDDTDNKQTA